ARGLRSLPEGVLPRRPFTNRGESMSLKLKSARAALVAATIAAAFSAMPARAAAPTASTIKIGILHSLSGTMAISETTLKDVMLMLIDDQNKKGGVLGKQLEPVVVDPASNWP